MFSLDDGQLVLAATDLTNHLACPHLTQQRLAIARGERSRPPKDEDPHAELIRRRGDDHETEQLQRLSDECGGHLDLTTDDEFPRTRQALDAAADRTLQAMREGAPLIYQAHFFDGHWQGRTDFLRKIEAPSAFDGYAYEVLDTKLARQVKPAVVHQLSLYNRLLARVQGYEPSHAHVVLGDASTETIDLGRYAALHRHTVKRLEQIVATPGIETYPEPVAHCPICQLEPECRVRRIKDDHLSLVANARRDQRRQLVELSLPTVAALAEADEHTDAGRLGAERFDVLHHQAALQVESRTTGQPTRRHLQPTRAAGYAAIPPPSAGDIFFDFEGDPYIGDGGIEYLWGWWTEAGDYECIWAHDADQEKAALEKFVDRVVAERAEHPGMHVFHYAPHERAKLGSLAVHYATREAEVDQMLRDGVLVDLYAVVRRAMQVGEESYSLKKLERHHGFRRLERSVREGGGSIVAYEEWLEKGDDAVLEAIRAYNEEDCLSTLSLRDWLLDEMLPEAETGLEVDFADFRDPEPEEPHEPPKWMPDVQALVARLTAGLAAEGDEDTPDQAERRLLSHLLLYHYRENKPQWWRHYALREMPVAELFYERDAVAGLVRDESVPPVPHKKSFLYTFTFPEQEAKLPTGTYEDPTTERNHKVVEVSDRKLVISRKASDPPPCPVALVPQGPPDAGPLRNAIVDLAESVLTDDGSFPAARGLLRREPPRLASGRLGEDVDSLISAALGLDHSCLPVQGPPGTGKTFRGARMVVAALQAGLRVGITAQSHAAIQNMLCDVEKHAHEMGAEFSGICRGDSYDSAHGLVALATGNKGVEDEHQLVGGTTWLFARDEHRQRFDLLFVDEAGQLSLASTAAAGLCARSMVFLGDPQQLPQVTQADHPDGSGASVLEHLLQGRSTIPEGRGVLLTESWRMHPGVCAFVSERSYEGKLRSREACGLRRVDTPRGLLTGTGLRVREVEHEGRSQASPEEAEVIAAACHDLLAGGLVTDDRGITRPLKPADIMVVAPYNLAVLCIEQAVPRGVRVGTVDRFQGQQAAVVLFAMTCSSGEDVPRGLEFLFDGHRLNVAVSRAECLAVLVVSPRLLDAECRSLEAMDLVDGACRFVEMATASGGEL